jgi:hypothetical protein
VTSRPPAAAVALHVPQDGQPASPDLRLHIGLAHDDRIKACAESPGR